MTCIAGVVERGKVWIGADSGGVNTSTWTAVERVDSKVFRVGEFTIGYTSSFRMGQVLRFNLVPPTQEPAQDLLEFMVTKFVEAVRKCFSDAGFAKKENNVERGGEFLIGYRGRLFCIEGDYQVGECAEGYQAVGSGEAVALGSLYTSAVMNMSPIDRIRLALASAAHHNIGVRGPFVVLEPEETKPARPNGGWCECWFSLNSGPNGECENCGLVPHVSRMAKAKQ